MILYSCYSLVNLLRQYFLDPYLSFYSLDSQDNCFYNDPFCDNCNIQYWIGLIASLVLWTSQSFLYSCDERNKILISSPLQPFELRLDIVHHMLEQGSLSYVFLYNFVIASLVQWFLGMSKPPVFCNGLKGKPRVHKPRFVEHWIANATMI